MNLKKVDAIYLGAIGHPDVKPGVLEQGILIEHSISAGSIYQPQACPNSILAWKHLSGIRGLKISIILS